ncbi:M23 family metallopeptidase [Virgibacillus salarius]|uniref:M23 family metallopeptidase n=1 Tax=Virgibacillus salarius TaxID=447199 RepID=UPI0024911BEB|nr:M23 family metallopeptidase [Virgibacillus salarius]WBX81433.1 M23 family metallopeptidase [Virgibacillus salarius]
MFTKGNKASSSLYIKLGVFLLIATFFTVSTVYAADDLKTVYHAYIDGEHIGKVDNEQAIQQMIDKKIAAVEHNDDNLTLRPKQDISLISEKVFNPTFDNEKVLAAVQENITIEAEAIELKIGDKTVGFFKDYETAEQVIASYKAEYVDKQEWQALEEKMAVNPDNQRPTKITADDLEVGDRIVTSIELSNHVTYTDGVIDPEKLLTVEQGLTMMKKGTLEEQVHKVDEGEVLGEIASKYNLSMEELLELNKSLAEDSVLHVNQAIHVTAYRPFAEVVVKEAHVAEENVKHETKVIKSDELYKGEEKVKQQGKHGKKEVLYAMEKRNGEEVNQTVIDEKIIKKPQKEIIIKGTKVIPSRGTGKLTWPAVGGHISSPMGKRWGSVHKGIDIAGPSSRTIKAADNGTIVSAGYDNGGYGNKIVINHNNGMKTIYAHLASMDVEAGETVEKGSKIGVMGTTGRSTGIHLHFELYKDGVRKDPTDYLK